MADFTLPMGANRMTLEASFVDASGAVVKPDDTPAWAVDSPLVSLNPSNSGRNCIVKRVAPRNRAGNAVVTMTSTTSDGLVITQAIAIQLQGNGPVSVSIIASAITAEP